MKVTECQVELLQLAKVATTQPHATYAAFIHGFVQKLMFLPSTTPIKDPLLQPVVDIRTRLLPAWMDTAPPSNPVHELFTLPAHLGGAGIINPASCSSKEFLASVSISAPLSYMYLVESQQSNYAWQALEAHQRSQESMSAAAHIKYALSDSL